MAYNSSYEEGDIASSTISLIVKMVLAVATFVTLIVVVYIFGYVKKKLN